MGEVKLKAFRPPWRMCCGGRIGGDRKPLIEIRIRRERNEI